ncbi:hypothetical protein [Agromyces albus]|uniref:DUF2336 domain-containing protein n=1 Tax=Agromyces albus TaxID=205332 RepID=A0A4Q2L4B0_9MICO|nr:hypothetical protein [Agromyces albus]RXZ71700.1 hypothetical protein ESP51_07325 [Agromyces albus]
MSNDAERNVIDLARHGTYIERLQVSGLQAIDAEVLEVLLADPDPRIVRATLQNTRVTTEMLRHLARTRPEFTEPAARHVNAPPELMGIDIIWHLGAESVDRFSRHKAATEAQRAAFIREYRQAGERHLHRSVADVWSIAEREG